MKMNFLTKNKLCVIAILVLIVIIAPMTVRAADTALPEASNGVITLKDDVELSATYVIENGEDLTLDLNGYTISGPQKVFDVKGAKLTITGKGTIKETQPNYAPIHITGDSANEAVINVGKDVTLEGWSGIMTSKDTVRDAKITIKMDGKINAVNDMGGGVGSGIYINGNLVNKDKIKVELSATTEINSTGDAIYGAGYAVWIINGSTLRGVTTAIGIKSGSFEINNAMVTATGKDDRPTEGYGNGINPSGAAIQIESNVGYAGDIKLDIDGGIYKSENGVAFYEYLSEEKGKETKETKVISLNIEDGEFVSAESKPVFAVSEDFLNKITKFVKGGTFNKTIPSQYIALDGNINIKLTEDINIETTIIPNGSKVTIDLNGHTILGPQKIFDVKGAELTIIGKGTIKETQPNYAPIHITGDSANEAVINVGKDVTLEGWSGIMTSKDTVRDAKITIKMNGKINAVNDMGGGVGSGIYINGNLVNKDKIKVELSSTTEINSTGDAIYGAGYADWTINGSTLSGVTTAIGIKSGNFDINNAIVTATGKDDRPTEGYGNGINPSGAAIQIESNDGYAGNIKIDIDGGIYKSENGVAFYEYLSKEENKETLETKVICLNITNGEFISAESKPVFAVSGDFTNKITKFIKGGTFTSDVTEYIAEECYAGKQENGYYVVKQIVDITNCEVTGIVNKTYTGEALTQDIVVKLEDDVLKNGTDYTVKYENNKEIGTATVTITGKGYYKGTLTKKFEISPISIESAIVTGISNKTYTGEALTQDIVVKLEGVILKNGTDYTVKYENNKEIGTATLTITGKGYYKGTITKIFKINPISIEKATVTGISNKTYTGKGLTQNLTVKLDGKTLINGTDYTVSYSNNTKPGKATLIITGKGVYEGKITKTFLITPKKFTGLKVTEQTTSKIKLSWSKHEGVTGYKVYSYNYSKNKWEYEGKTTGTSYTVQSLKAGTTYKYRVRAYKNIDGVQCFGDYTTSVKTATKPKTPSVKVKVGDKKVTLTWDKISGATGYEIYMATSKNGKYEKIKTISNNKTFKYTKSGLKTNKKYYFKVRAYRTVDDKKVYSSYSKVQSATTKKVYIVKKGDNLYRIAKNNKTTVAKLVKINNLKKATLIRIGLRLLLN